MLMPEPYRSEHDTYLSNYLTTGKMKIIGRGREVFGRRSDGTIFPINLAVSEFTTRGRRYFAGIISDISERKRMEDALIESERKLGQAQRLEAVGQLTGGIAHDFNNLLTVIVGNLELVDMRTVDQELRSMLKQAQEAADLGAKLTHRLLAFARRSHLEPQILKINELILSVTGMLRRTLGEQVTLSSVLAHDLWSTRTDPSQVETAIVNLAINSRDAMPKGGKLVIETSNVTLDRSVRGDPDLIPGEYVRISVSDTGTGMLPEVRERAFEPFFTTKARGHGTGLGLSMVYGFAKQSGGGTMIYSEPGHGTTINVYLPRASEDVATTPPVAERAEEGVSLGKTILVVEDDERVRHLTVTRLKNLGYRVEEAPDGGTAIKMLEKGLKADLVFTDLVMPDGVSGHDVMRRAREVQPGIRLLLTSGYAEDLVNSEVLGDIKLLRKPYRLRDLRDALETVLQAQSNPSCIAAGANCAGGG